MPLCAPTGPPPRKPSTVTHHGITVSDDYAWLRDSRLSRGHRQGVLEHLAAENAWFEARMAPHQGTIDALFRRMRARIKEADKSVRRRTATSSTGSSSRKAPSTRSGGAAGRGGSDELILDEPALAEGKEYFRLGAISTSKDGRPARLLGRRQRLRALHVRIKDLATGEHCPTRSPARSRRWCGSRRHRA
jgi:oligopeptidase B